MKEPTLLIDLHYMPPIAAFAMIAAFENIRFESKEHYVKSTFRNRCYISGPNGLQRLSIPLQRGKNQHCAVDEVKISYDENWQKDHWGSLQSAYRRSSFFEFYEDEFAAVFFQQTTHLFEFNFAMFKLIQNLIGTRRDVTFTTEYDPMPEHIYNIRSVFRPGKTVLPPWVSYRPIQYIGVFSEAHTHSGELSILDLLFNEGPNSLDLLKSSIQINL